MAFKGKVYKQMLGNEKANQVNSMINNGQAIPDVRFKLDIFNHRFQICESEADTQHSKEINNGIVNPIRKLEFELALIKQFNDIKYMLIEKELHKGQNAGLNLELCYTMTIQLEYRKRKFTVDELIMIKNYLEYVLHVIRITNLLINMNEENPEADEIFKQVMMEY